jgi:hypothetical protein
LYGLLVHADHRASGIVRRFVRFQHVLHVRNKLSGGCMQDHPVLDLSPAHAVSQNTSNNIVANGSTISNATTWRGSNRNVQSEYPL